MPDLTIGELAERSGLSARNIRLYQTRGMIAPPARRGREAVYGEQHLERLALIQRLLADGMSRDLVQRLLQSDDESVAHLLQLRDRATHPATAVADVRARVIGIEELLERFGEDVEALQASIQAGLLEPQADGTFIAPNPEMLAIAERAQEVGVPLAASVEIGDFARQQVAEAARFFVEVMRRRVWEPFDAAGRPDDRWNQIGASFEQTQALPEQVYAALFPEALLAEVRRVTTEVLDAEARERAPGGLEPTD